jgi:hypothetical protein
MPISEKLKVEIVEMTVLGFELEEICDFYELQKDEAEPFYKKGLFLRKEKILAMQWAKAEAGDSNLQIHMGRHLIGQSEKIENHHTMEIIPHSDMPREKLLQKVDQLRIEVTREEPKNG